MEKPLVVTTPSNMPSAASSKAISVPGTPNSRSPTEKDSNDPVQIINLMFPTEQSITQLDHYSAKLDQKLLTLDKEIKTLLRPVDHQQDLQSMQKTIEQLKRQITDINGKAQHAEKTVQNITKDIKSLDTAKKNLTQTVTLLKRLQMLVSAVDQLRVQISRRNYKEMASLFQAVSGLKEQFKMYKNIKQINDLLESVKTLQEELKRMIFSDFEGSFSSQGTFTGNALNLSETCLVVATMEPEVKKQLLDWYCELQLREYRSIFRNNDEVGNLENIARRFAWLKRVCKSYDEEHSAVFPIHWHVSELVCERFCADTRDDLAGFLNRNQNTIDVKALVKGLQTTLEFESGLNRRFQINPEKRPPPALNFVGKISIAFEPHLKLYIETEDKTLAEMMEKFKQKNILTEEELQTGVFSASTDLFLFYRQTMINMAKLNTRKAYLDLSKLFSKYLILFCDQLNAKTPKIDDRKPSTLDEIKMTCLILNTAEYCQTTSSQLEEKIKERIDQEFKEKVDMTKEKEAFLMLVTNTIQALVRQVNSTLAPAFLTMTKIPWSSLQTVGDQSEYVTQLAITLNTNVSLIRRLIIQNAGSGGSTTSTSGSAKQFRWFCDKFVDFFVPYFLKNIYQCKPISEIGAEQLLLDTHAVKTILLDLPNFGAEQKIPPSAVFSKFVIKGISKAETLLKVVLTPLDPPEMIIKNYLILCGENSEEENKQKQRDSDMKEGFIKILDLKGVKKADQPQLIDLLMARLSKSNIPVPTLSVSAPPPPPLPPVNVPTSFSSLASGLASIQLKNVGTSVSDAGSKFNENLRKIGIGGISSIGGNWLKRDNISATNLPIPPPPPAPPSKK